MKIDEAIKILALTVQNPYHYEPPDTREAVKLGIEALKDLQYFDKIRGSSARLRLPRETK